MMDGKHRSEVDGANELLDTVRIGGAGGGEGEGRHRRDTLVHLTGEELGGSLQGLAGGPELSARYRPLGTLGEGGMGRVDAVEDVRIGRRVAFKTLRPDLAGSAEAMGRFLREARVQGQLEHPAIVPVYDLAVDGGGAAYFTMKRVRGDTLEDVLEGLRGRAPDATERWTRRRLLEAFLRVCQAVDFAHQRGVLHRDLKPANVMLGDFGEVYVLDWGVARVASDAEGAALRSQLDLGQLADLATGGQILGTPHFMAPEQLLGEPAGSLPSADVYALGAILFEVLTLQPFNGGTTLRDVMAETLTGVEARPSVRAPAARVPPELEAILQQATAREPEARFPTARALGDALERFLEGERNETLRQALAAQHGQAAAAAVAALARQPAASEDARRSAMQEVGRALALDPANQQAQDAFLQILAQPPREMPAEVLAELQASEERQWRWTGRVAGVAYLSLALYLPLFLWSGVRSSLAVAVFFGAALVAGLASLGVGFARRPRAWMVLGVFLLSTLCYASSHVFFGALVLTPALIATNTAGYAILLRGALRWLAILLAGATLYTLVFLELLETFGTHYAFTPEGMVIKPAAIGLSLGPTVALLSVAALATLVTASLATSRVRDALARAEERIHLQVWQIRQLLPTMTDRGQG